MKARPASTNQVEPTFVDGVQVRSGIDAQGKELPDGTPLSPPVGYEYPPTLEEIVAQLVHRRDLARAADAAGYDTFDEADDFELEDEDYDPRFPETIYEAYFEAKSRRKAEVASRQERATSRRVSEGSEASPSPPSQDGKQSAPVRDSDTAASSDRVSDRREQSQSRSSDSIGK